MASENEASENATKVFGTYELLEKILIDVLHYKNNTEGIDEDGYFLLTAPLKLNHASGMREICRLQRVNRTFRNVIVDSTTLKLATFRRHNYSEETEEKKGANGPSLVLNPLLANLYQCTGTYYTSVELWKRSVGSRKRKEKYLHVLVMVGSMPQPLPNYGSWRSMLVANEAMDEPLKIEIEVHHEPCKTSKLKAGWDHDMTLGELAYKIDMIIRNEVLQGHRN